jgi:hypothetical protein
MDQQVLGNIKEISEHQEISWKEITGSETPSRTSADLLAKTKKKKKQKQKNGSNKS